MNNDPNHGGQQFPSVQPGFEGPGGPPFNAPPQKKSMVLLILAIGFGVCACGGVPILAAILFPVFAQAKESAQAAVCLSNLKQLSLGMIVYSSDHDDRLPSARNWHDATLPNMKSSSVHQCPKSESKDANRSDYAMNRDLSRANLEKLDNPETTIMLFEAAGAGKNKFGSVEMMPDPSWHGSRGNAVAYADGHVVRLREGEN